MNSLLKCSAIVITALLATNSVWGQNRPQFPPPGQGSGSLTPVSPGQPPSPPPKLRVDQNQLNQISSSAGSTYAQEVIERIGELYNVKLNLVRGMNRAVQMIGDHDSLSEIRSRSPQYQSSYSAGIPEGEHAGFTAGDAAANSSAQKLADSDITKLIDDALDSGLGTNIKFIMNPRASPFTGLSSPLDVPSRLFSSRFVDSSSSVQSQFQQVLMNPISPWSPYFRDASNVNDLVRRDENNIPAMPYEFSPGNAARSFHNNTIDTNRWELSQASSYYRDIGSDKYETPGQNQSYFDQNFNSSYSWAMNGNAWYSRVTSYNSRALDLGQRIYTDIATTLGQEVGRADGWAVRYTQSSVDGYNTANQNFGAYKNQFAKIVDQVMNSSYVSEIDAMVVPEIHEKTEFTFGDTFNVVVKRIANRGMKAGKVSVDIATEGNAKSMGYPHDIDLPPMTRVKQSNEMIRVGWIADITAADEDVTLTAVINAQRFSSKFRVTFEETLRKVTKNEVPTTSDWMMGRVATLLQKEYTEKRGYKNFAHRDPALMLMRMKSFFDKLPESDKINIRRHGQMIRNAYGPEEIGISGADWKATQQIMSEMQLAGKSPVDNTPIDRP